jgi:Na+-driven multidrug efflux pump
MQSTEALVTIVLNIGLQEYGGDLYVGSLTILQSVMQLIIIPVNGMTQGVQPVISYNYGARNFDRVKKTFKIVLITDLAVTVICCLLTQFIPGFFGALFTDEAALIELVKEVMPVFFGGIWIFGVQMACQSAFMGMGQAKVSLFLALLRKVILLIPLALILPKYFDVMGIYYAEPVADIVAAVTTGVVFLLMSKKLLIKPE